MYVHVLSCCGVPDARQGDSNQRIRRARLIIMSLLLNGSSTENLNCLIVDSLDGWDTIDAV